MNLDEAEQGMLEDTLIFYPYDAGENRELRKTDILQAYDKLATVARQIRPTRTYPE